MGTSAKKDTLKIEYDGTYYGIVSKNNKIVVPFEYDEIVNTFSSGLINVCKNDKWGCLDLEGNIVIPLVYDWIFPFGKDPLDTTSAKRNGKWGIIDRKGTDIIPCVYDEEIVFKHDRAVLSANGKMGMIDKEGNVIIPFEYYYVKPFTRSLELIKVAKNNKCGVIDIFGEIRIPAIYDEICDIRGDFLIIKQDGLCGIINTRGKVFVPNKYVKIEYFVPQEGLSTDEDCQFPQDAPEDVFAVTTGHKWKYIIVNEEIANEPEEYDWTSGLLSHNSFLVKRNHKFGLVRKNGQSVIPIEYSHINLNSEYIILTKAGRCGLTDWEGNEIVPVCYKDIRILSGKSAILKDDSLSSLYFFDKNITPQEYDSISYLYGNLCKVSRNGKFGIIDEDGNTVIPLIFDCLGYYDYIRKTMPAIKDSKYGIIDINGYEVIPIIYDPIEEQELKAYGNVNDMTIVMSHIEIYMGAYIAMIMKLKGKWGVINSEGKEIIPFIYDQMDYYDKKLLVKATNKMGVISVDGKQIIPLSFDEVILNYEEGLLLARKNNRWGLMDKNGKEILSFEYDSIEPVLGKIIASKGGKKGVFNKKGKLIVPLEYDDIKAPDFMSGTYSVCKDGKWGVLNKDGKSITRLEYDKINDYGFACGRLAVRRNAKWGFINRKGQEVIPCVYDEVFQFFEDNHCEVKLNGKKITININGERIG